jgi:hypothetical protein
VQVHVAVRSVSAAPRPVQEAIASSPDFCAMCTLSELLGQWGQEQLRFSYDNFYIVEPLSGGPTLLPSMASEQCVYPCCAEKEGKPCLEWLAGPRYLCQPCALSSSLNCVSFLCLNFSAQVLTSLWILCPRPRPLQLMVDEIRKG